MTRKSAIAIAAGFMLVAVLALPTPAVAQDNIYVSNLKGVQDKFLSLAEAIPADKYGWRPGEGVRSVSEVFMHIASSNYALGGRLGGPQAPADAREWEKTVTAKADVIAKMKESFAALSGTLGSADLNQGNAARTALMVVSHAHEHLGQMIAYARANGVVPPWSQ
jgi:uncharacterized damage-inducible protein DinB